MNPLALVILMITKRLAYTFGCSFETTGPL